MLNRRQMIGGSISGFFAFAARNSLARIVDEVASGTIESGKAKRCVVLWMDGGPSQLDTFDPKPGKRTGGPVQAINTSADDLQISEYLPSVAQQMHNLSVIRNLTSKEGEHVRARHYLHTGFKFVPSFPRPSIGSVVSAQMPTLDFPKYVSLGSPGFGPAYMGPANAPFSVQNMGEARQMLDRIKQRSGRLELLGRLDERFSSSTMDKRVIQRRANMEKIQRMADTGFAKALDVERFSQNDRARYGESEFGRRCLVARQLLDLGVNFVEVQMSGWDTHERNFKSVKRLCSIIDKPFAALVQDLKSSGMFEDTILIWMGEFGRTPNINSRNGRDHYPLCTPAVIAGGPFRGGQAIGKTNNLGTSIVGEEYKVPDLFATVFSVFGIDPDQEFTTDFDSPTAATDEGKIIHELFG